MKKLVLFIALLSISISLSSQSIFYGVKVGPQFADLIGYTEDAIPRLGFHFGFVMEVEIYDKFSFQSELLYSSQGAKGFLFSEDLKINYLNLPLLAKYYMIENFSVEAGAQLGYLLSAKTKENGQTINLQSISDFEVSLIFGLGYKIDNGLHFGVRYNYGVTNTYSYFSPIIRNSVLQFSIGYFFIKKD